MDPFSEKINKECIFFINNETYHQNGIKLKILETELVEFFLYEQIKIVFVFFIFVFMRNIFGLLIFYIFFTSFPCYFHYPPIAIPSLSIVTISK